MEEQDDGYGFAASFSEKAVRLGFIRKVYSILCIQVPAPWKICFGKLLRFKAVFQMDLCNVETDPGICTLDYGSGFCSFRQCLSRCLQKISFFQVFLLNLLTVACRYIYISLHRYQVIKKSKKSWIQVFSTFFSFLLRCVTTMGISMSANTTMAPFLLVFVFFVWLVVGLCLHNTG